jgi:outer membrane protein OmpA-like peptidoglycan-associated protein
MKYCYYIILLISLFTKTEIQSQTNRFIVKRIPFSSGLNDEFSPVFYKGGIVFCSNLRDNSLVSYKNDQSRLLKIFYVTKKESTEWRQPKLLSKELTTGFNDGPVTFNENGTVIYFNRNNIIGNQLRNISDTSNKLGIYSAEFVKGIWTNIKPFTFNNHLYSFCTPSLTPDGKRIYFSSDMPGGYGGTDLYYCDSLKDGWDRPVNLGPLINTPKNESFPFACKYGKLFFASDGHKGFGGKDLYYTQEINGKWIDPVHLDSAINSKYDDFGIVTDSTFEKGYFSSNRLKTDDIFSYSSAPVKFLSCDTIHRNNYCFTLFDEKHRLIDTIQATYIWDFGDGIKRVGTEVKHCFPGPGKYLVRLSIFDDLTGNIIADQVNYNVEIEDIQQAFINSYNVGIADEPVSFDGAKINLKDFRITDYFWNFGDGFYPGGPLMNKVFKKKGEYAIQLGLLGEKDSLGKIQEKCFMKKIRIFDSFQELGFKGEEGHALFNEKPDSAATQEKKPEIMIYFMDDLSERQKSKIKAMITTSGELTINFNKYGLLPVSYLLLDKIIQVLKENPDIKLEMAVHGSENELSVEKMNISEKWSQELAFYFRNNGSRGDSFISTGFGLSPSVFKPVLQGNNTNDGAIEFIFMKN